MTELFQEPRHPANEWRAWLENYLKVNDGWQDVERDHLVHRAAGDG